jgi:hypothetical protein
LIIPAISINALEKSCEELTPIAGKRSVAKATPANVIDAQRQLSGTPQPSVGLSRVSSLR